MNKAAREAARELRRQRKKNDASMYDRLLACQLDAIRNAKRLWTAHDEGDDFQPVTANPSTTVHLLVERLISLRP